MRFTAVIDVRGINPFVPVSAARAKRLKVGWRRPMPVLVRVDGKPEEAWRINLMPAGDGSFYLYLHGAVREASGTKVGDKVTVELAFDQAYRGGPTALPAWFKAALARDKAAAATWARLPPSRQKEVVRYLAGLKSQEAKDRNLAKAMRVLGGKPGRWMARDWRDGA